MTRMKLMMMMTLSEEVDEVSFDPTASGRLFSAVQNIIGRSDRDIQLWSQPQRQSLENLLVQRKRRRSAKVVTTPARRRWNRAVKLVRLMVMSVRWWLMWLVVRLTGLVMMLVRCWWIKGISFLYAPKCHSSEVSSSLSKKVLQRGDPWEKFHLDQIPTERALRHRWHRVAERQNLNTSWSLGNVLPPMFTFLPSSTFCQVLGHHRHMASWWVQGNFWYFLYVAFVSFCSLCKWSF